VTKPHKIKAESAVTTTVIYGASGVGKTTLAATAPKPIFLDSNKGTLSIAGRPGLEHVVAVDVEDEDQLNEAYDNFTGTGDINWAKIYGSIIFDHFDDIQGIIMERLGDIRSEKRGRDPDEAEQRDYGIMGAKMRRYIRKFKNVRIHKILICGETTDKEEGRLRPSLVGALKHQLPYFADHTMYLRLGKKGARYLHLDATDDFYAKTRAWWLPPELRKMRIDENDPTTLTKLFAAIAAGPNGSPKRRSKEK
jgi:hypothetical protein